MKVWVLILFIIACYDVIAQSKDVIKEEAFIQYKNENTIAMGMDGAVIKDKYFTLKIPNGLVDRRFIGTSAFMQILSFEDQSKIILLYIPNADSSANYNLVHLAYKKFIDLLHQENIAEYLEDDEGEIDFKHKGFFGINKLENGSFYALYLNVKRRHLKLYQHSINSVRF